MGWSLRQVLQQARTGQFEFCGDEADADCVLGQSFGMRQMPNGDVDPGYSNRILASAISTRPRLRALPKILQFEIADCLSISTRDNPLFLRVGDPSSYVNTREVLTEEVQLMKNWGLRRPILVAHPYHVGRCAAVARKLGISPIVPFWLTEAAIFDPNSSQPWTRDPKSWYRKERFVILYFKLRGWI